MKQIKLTHIVTYTYLHQMLTNTVLDSNLMSKKAYCSMRRRGQKGGG